MQRRKTYPSSKNDEINRHTFAVISELECIYEIIEKITSQLDILSQRISNIEEKDSKTDIYVSPITPHVQPFSVNSSYLTPLDIDEEIVMINSAHE